VTETLTSSIRTYDDFSGSELDMSRWSYLEYPMPVGPAWRATEPDARLTVSGGTFSIHVEKFKRAHDAVQIIDNPKLLLLSTEIFPLPRAGVARFSAEMAAQVINGNTDDFRDGFAAFNVLDFSKGFVFDVAANGDHLWAIHEVLPVETALGDPFTYMIENPYGPGTTAGDPQTCQVSFNTIDSTVTWLVDGEIVTRATLRVMPESVQLGLGLFTLRPIVNGQSRSLHGQGITASWSDVRVEIEGA
jgi:Family of unknown function (DUF6081)